MREREKRKMREKRWKSRSVSMATDPFSQLTVDKSIGAMLGPGTLRRGLIEAGLPLLFFLFFFRKELERAKSVGKPQAFQTAFFFSWLFLISYWRGPFSILAITSPSVCFEKRQWRFPELTIIGGAIFERYSEGFFFAPSSPQSLPFCSFLLGLEAGILFSGKEFSISEFKRTGQVLFLSIFLIFIRSCCFGIFYNFWCMSALKDSPSLFEFFIS